MRKFAIVVVAGLLAAAAQACGGIDEPNAENQNSAAQVVDEPVGDAEQEIGGFSLSLFPFRTTVEEDGSDVGVCLRKPVGLDLNRLVVFGGRYPGYL